MSGRARLRFFIALTIVIALGGCATSIPTYAARAHLRSAIDATLAAPSYRVDETLTIARPRRTIVFTIYRLRTGRVRVVDADGSAIAVDPTVYNAVGNGMFTASTLPKDPHPSMFTDYSFEVLQYARDATRITEKSNSFAFSYPQQNLDFSPPPGLDLTISGTVTTRGGRVSVLSETLSRASPPVRLQTTFRFSYVAVPDITPPPANKIVHNAERLSCIPKQNVFPGITDLLLPSLSKLICR